MRGALVYSGEMGSKRKKKFAILTICLLAGVVIAYVVMSMVLRGSKKWDICLDSEFDTLADVNAYAVHPDHVAAAGLLKEVKADRACVDYEF